MRSASIALAICSVPASALAPSEIEASYDGTACAGGGRSRQSQATSGGVSQPSLSSSDEALLQRARTIVAMRNRRDRHFRAYLFAEPAWDMMLDLFIAHLEGRQVYVTSLCIASNVPNTTALRYIQDMVKHGEIVSSADVQDGRRRWLSLSEGAVAAMKQTVMATATTKVASAG